MTSDGEAVTAFAPGHVTGFFSVSASDAEESARTGSRGAGVTLSEGVTVAVAPGGGGRDVVLNGDPTDVESAFGVLDALGVDARVYAETELPLGAGFGVSGATALATALAANEAFDCGRSENDLVRVAHAAEVEAGTGLGDVVAQARGGVPVRLEAGAPPYGSLDGVPASGHVEYVSFGGLSTSEVIGGDTSELSAAGEDALDGLRADPTLPEFFAASRRFARAAGLLDGEVEDAIAAVRAEGGEAAMAMLGRTVFALGTGLSDAGYDAERCEIHRAGASLR
ncbi:pantoate kinase [Halobacterium rubrum]|uniref:pantoate kinase n=1 Tax=Halobacterium TaxID=2239 RepID=UPI001F18D7E6|nr:MULTISPECIES: pantoate kinase [Halobacterium]MDH5020139.1 pantoate kinase [Halobacterium rubrum]